MRLPTALRRARVRHYARSYLPCKGDPKVRVRGFAQETGGPLGTYAKELQRACAESTPPYGLPTRAALAPGTAASLSASPCRALAAHCCPAPLPLCRSTRFFPITFVLYKRLSL